MTSNPKMPCRDITELCPTLERAAREFLKRCAAANLNVLITQTYRSAEYQNSLYQQGRTKPGNIVTNLDGYKSTSPHQYRIAFDICKNVPGQEYSFDGFFKQCGSIWKDMGGVWGGDWTGFVDAPHFEFTDGKGYAPFRNSYKFPDNFQMKWEKEKSDDMLTQEQFEQMYKIMVNKKRGDNPSEWAKEITEVAKEKKLFVGDGNGNYNWQMPVTKEGFCSLLRQLKII